MGRKKGVILSYILMIFEVLSTLLLTPFIIRSFGQAEYGVYKLVASVVAYLALLDLGIGNSVIRFTAKYHQEGDGENLSRFFGVAQIYYVIIGIVALAVGVVLTVIFPYVFAKGLTNEEIVLGQKLLFIVSLNTAVTLMTAVFTNIIIGLGYFAVSKGASIIQIVIKIVVTYIALALGYKSIAVVTINLVTTIGCKLFFVIFVFAKLKLKPKLRGVNKGFIFSVIGYSSWILLQMIATQINAFADQVLLGILVPGASMVIAVYGVGAQVVQYFQSIGGAIGGVLFPGVVSLVGKGADSAALENEMIRIGRISLIVLLAIWGGFILYGRQFIALWAGAEYEDAYLVALILMTAHLFIQVESIGTQILWAKNEHKEQAILKFAIVLVNIVLTILLIRWNALFGATIGTFISLILGDVFVMNLVFKRKIGIGLWSYYKGLLRGILLAFLITMAAGFLFSLLKLEGWGGFFVNIIVFSIVYIVSVAFVGMNKTEKNMMLSIMKKFKRKKQS